MTNPEYARDLADELSCVRGDLEEASAEIERLRAALQRIAGSDTRPHAAGDIARQALSCERAQSEPECEHKRRTLVAGTQCLDCGKTVVSERICDIPLGSTSRTAEPSGKVIEQSILPGVRLSEKSSDG